VVPAVLNDPLNIRHSSEEDFRIPTVPIRPCRIDQDTPGALVLQEASLIIWDEAPMTHRHNYEAVDRSLRDLLRVQKPFGGLTVLFGGDFRQVLPVVPRGTRSQITAASLKRSTLWPHISIKRLTVNMRVRMLASGANAGTVEAQLAALQDSNLLTTS